MSEIIEEFKLTTATSMVSTNKEQPLSIEIKKKYSNESLLFIRFLKQKLNIRANFVYLYQKMGIVFVTKKPVYAARCWEEYIQKQSAFSDYNLKFVSEKESWDIKDLIHILLPQISVHKVKILDDDEILVVVPQKQIKFAIGKNRRNLDLLTDFMKQLTPYSKINMT